MRRIIQASCLLALLISRAAAQAPHIDHLAIDDPTGRLTIFGSFGSTPGTITIDSVLTPWSLWSPDSVICTIPDSGRGACGPVRVGAAGYSSNEKLLSAWYVHFSEGMGGPCCASSTDVHLIFRLDLLRALQSKAVWSIQSTSNSRYECHSRRGYGINYDSVEYFDSTHLGSRPLSFDASSRIINIGTIWIYQIRYDGGENNSHDWQTQPIQLDSQYNIKPQSYQLSNHEGLGINADSAAKFIPPDSLLYAAQSAILTQRTEQPPPFAVHSDDEGMHVTFASSAEPRYIRLMDILGRQTMNLCVPAGQTAIVARFRLAPGVYAAEWNGSIYKFIVTR